MSGNKNPFSIHVSTAYELKEAKTRAVADRKWYEENPDAVPTCTWICDAIPSEAPGVLTAEEIVAETVNLKGLNFTIFFTLR